MKTIEGYDVKIFTDNIEENALEQIKELLSIDVFSDKKIRIMPDVHAGAGCVIGFTGDLGDKVISWQDPYCYNDDINIFSEESVEEDEILT